jgi:DNA (cytosine-5)-methyltransferase 1
VSLLRPYSSDPSRNPTAGTPDELEGENVFKVEKILDHKDKKRPGKAKNKHKRMFLIRWEGYSPSDDTWEPEENLLDCKEALEEYWRTAEARGRLG